MSPRGKALSALVAALVLGFAAGVIADRGWLRERASTAASDDAFVTTLTRAVGLDTTQVRSVRAILARHQRTVDSAWQLMRPNVHAAIVAARGEIEAVLRPDQRERYERWLAGTHPGMPARRSDSAGP